MTSPQAVRSQLLDMLEELDDRLEQITDGSQAPVEPAPASQPKANSSGDTDSTPTQARD